MAERMQNAIEESVKLGARRILFSTEEFGKTVRIMLEPEKEHIAELKIFISHATPDLNWALKIKEILSEIGFQVILVEPATPSDVKNNAEISNFLASLIEESDYLCLLFSKNSVPRDWVRFEFNLAALKIGRVILIKDQTVGTIDDFKMRQSIYDEINPYPLSKIIVKHTIVDFQSDHQETGLEIARQIINDPEEGVTDGTYRPFVIRERNLKKENKLKRIVREAIYQNPLYKYKNIVDILPFFWDEIGVNKGDFEKAFDWFVEKYGRYNMRIQARKYKKIEIVPFELTISEKGFDKYDLSALIICQPDWNEAYEKNKNNVFY